jgi:hypothetical protein
VRRTLTAAAVALVIAAWSAPARADEQIVGLLDVAGADVDAAVLDRFTHAVEDGLAGGDMTAAPLARMREALARSQWNRDCLVGPCLDEVRAQTGADVVAIAALTAMGQAYRFTITLLDTRTGNVLSQVSEDCVACTVEDLGSSATMATIALLNGAGSTRTPDVLTPVAPLDQVKRLERRVADHKRTIRRGGLLLIGASLLAGGAAAYFLTEDRDEVGYPVAGAAGGLFASGAVVLGLSLTF